MRVGTSVAPINPRRPLIVAAAAQTAQAATHGRFSLGVGLGVPFLEVSVFGITTSNTVQRLVELVGRHRQAVVLTQRCARVVLSEQSLASQDWQYVVDEGLQSGRQRRGHDVEPVGGAAFEPRDDRVDDLVRRTAEGEVAASAAQSRQDLANGEAFALRQLDDEVRTALGALQFRARQDRVGQRLVELERRSVGLQNVRQLPQPVLRHAKFVQLPCPLSGFALSRADDRHDPRQHEHTIGITTRSFRPRLDVTVEVGGALVGLVGGEDGLRATGGEAFPSSEDPACTSSGWPCGGRSTLSGPATLK